MSGRQVTIKSILASACVRLRTARTAPKTCSMKPSRSQIYMNTSNRKRRRMTLRPTVSNPLILNAPWGKNLLKMSPVPKMIKNRIKFMPVAIRTLNYKTN